MLFVSFEVLLCLILYYIKFLVIFYKSFIQIRNLYSHKLPSLNRTIPTTRFLNLFFLPHWLFLSFSNIVFRQNTLSLINYMWFSGLPHEILSIPTTCIEQSLILNLLKWLMIIIHYFWFFIVIFPLVIYIGILFNRFQLFDNPSLIRYKFFIFIGLEIFLFLIIVDIILCQHRLQENNIPSNFFIFFFK